MSVGEFKVSRDRLVAELKLLILDMREMGLDEATTDLVHDRASKLISRADDCVSDRELDKIRAELGRLQSVVHEAVHRKGSKGA